MMTVRQYWVHYDEPMEGTPPEPAPAAEAASHPDSLQACLQEWEHLLNKLLDLLEPHPPIYRAALHLLSGCPTPLPPLPT